MTILYGKNSLLRLSRAMLGIGFLVALTLASGASFAGGLNEMRAAAEQGDADAQENLGVTYANGEGVPQNDVRAHMWSNLSASTGNAHAKEFLKILVKRMTREQIAEAQRLAWEWKPKP
jgi:TPR repeat protein